MKRDLAGSRALDANHAQSVTDFLAISNGHEPTRLVVRKRLAMGENTNLESLGKLRRGEAMIRIRHNDSRISRRTDQAVECSLLQRNRFDQVDPCSGRQA